MTLVEFLTAQYDKDAAYATLAQTGHRVRYTVSMDSPVGRALTPGELMAYLDHTKRFGPPRTLREVEAKRARLHLYDAVELTDPTTANMLRKVDALPYADDPDYEPEWKPWA